MASFRNFTWNRKQKSNSTDLHKNRYQLFERFNDDIQSNTTGGMGTKIIGPMVQRMGDIYVSTNVELLPTITNTRYTQMQH